MKFIYFLLLTLTIYYLLKALYRLVKLLISSHLHSTDHRSSKTDVKIEGKPSRFFTRSKDKGEYVDYEEIK